MIFSPSLPKSLPTSSGGLEAVEQVDPLDVVGERGVGHQGLVAVDVVDCKFERQLVHTHQLTLAGLENTACRAHARRDTHKMERQMITCWNCSNLKNRSCSNLWRRSKQDTGTVIYLFLLQKAASFT